MLDFLTIQTTSANPTLITVIYTVLMSFVLSFLIAFTYEKTFRGLSYSRNFVQALVLSSIVAATVMQAIGDSLGRGLGMIGALAIIRFRTNFKDPKDIIFMFAALAVGISTGVYSYNVALVGTFGFCIAAFILYMTPLGQTSYFDGMLRFNIESTEEAKDQLQKIMSHSTKKFAIITIRDLAQGNRLDYAYHIKLKSKVTKTEFVEDLRKIPSIKGINLLLQETTVEL